MTDNELLKELSHMAFIFERLGDIRKSTLIKSAINRINDLITEGK